MCFVKIVTISSSLFPTSSLANCYLGCFFVVNLVIGVSVLSVCFSRIVNVVDFVRVLMVDWAALICSTMTPIAVCTFFVRFIVTLRVFYVFLHSAGI